MPDPTEHNAGAARMVDDGRQALIEYVDRCKNMTPEAFATEPRALTSRLSAAQYAEVVRAIAPDAHVAQPDVRDARPRRDKRHAEAPQVAANRKTSFWQNVIPKTWRQTAIAALCGLAAVGVGAGLQWKNRPSPKPAPLIRSFSTINWPACTELAPTTDGCLFHNAAPLDWSLAARLLAQDLSVLRTNNRHLSLSYIPANSTLIVWRGTGQLVEANP